MDVGVHTQFPEKEGVCRVREGDFEDGRGGPTLAVKVDAVQIAVAVLSDQVGVGCAVLAGGGSLGHVWVVGDIVAASGINHPVWLAGEAGAGVVGAGGIIKGVGDDVCPRHKHDPVNGFAGVGDRIHANVGYWLQQVRGVVSRVEGVVQIDIRVVGKVCDEGELFAIQAAGDAGGRGARGAKQEQTQEQDQCCRRSVFHDEASFIKWFKKPPLEDYSSKGPVCHNVCKIPY